ncbi:MAG: hypothetical protein JNJ49_01940 [Bdellovibrionaceae bacterium]|nr:hypothetical protein [Pseudobdellovibrionaceae bacterium]
MTETAARMAQVDPETTTTTTLSAKSMSDRPYITQSSFYSPAFNGAIFDGPLRLYFSQTQEAMALKFYFELRTRGAEARWMGSKGPNVFVMIYPSEEIFDLCFASQGLTWAEERLPTARLGNDIVVAIQVDEINSSLERKVEQVIEMIGSIAAV